MFVTYEILEKNQACSHGKRWFKREFPDGAEMIDVINHPDVSKHTLHWGMTHLPSTDEEKQAYWRKVNVTNSDFASIYKSDNIHGCAFVTNSADITNSKYISSCIDVRDSTNIVSSSSVENSTQVYEGEFIYDSERIAFCKNVNDSSNIVHSDFIVSSNSIFNATNVRNSAYVSSFVSGATKDIRDSYFVRDCQNIEKCLFCNEISNAKYMIFNKQMTAEDYQLIVKQLTSILDEWELELVSNKGWATGISPNKPICQLDISKQYSALPDKFWRWVQTLPNFDPMIMYLLTFKTDMLELAYPGNTEKKNKWGSNE